MICIILGTSDGYEREMSTFLKSAPLIGPRFLTVAFIGRHLKFETPFVVSLQSAAAELCVES